MTPPMDEAMVVTQADRDAAARVVRWLRLSPVTGHEQHYAEMILAGHNDKQEVVQAFARHRIEASGAHELAGALDRVRELVDQEISAWAFANDIDGALRNDLMCRVRAALKRHRGEP